MRVIAGTHRSRQLAAPKGLDTRPTSDRLREALFNVLAPRIAGTHFVDLYAGSGAVGIEALSRGVAHVWFAEKAVPAVAAIRANLKALRIESGYTIDERGTLALLATLAEKGTAVDILFLDPPYDAAHEYQSTLAFLGGAGASAMFAADTMVVAEHNKKIPLAEKYGALERTRVLQQSDAALSFYRRVG